MIINYTNFNSKKLQPFKNLITNILEYACNELNIINELEVNLTITNKRQIKKVNKQTRNINKATDVLSFPTLNLKPNNVNELNALITKENFNYDVNPQTKHLFIGDILLCYKVIKKQAKKYNNTLTREMCYMTVHGFLHLLGFDHEKEKDKKIMRKYEEKILSKFDINK